jgi:hypothetical protein
MCVLQQVAQVITINITMDKNELSYSPLAQYSEGLNGFITKRALFSRVKAMPLARLVNLCLPESGAISIQDGFLEWSLAKHSVRHIILGY